MLTELSLDPPFARLPAYLFARPHVRLSRFSSLPPPFLVFICLPLSLYVYLFLSVHLSVCCSYGYRLRSRLKRTKLIMWFFLSDAINSSWSSWTKKTRSYSQVKENMYKWNLQSFAQSFKMNETKRTVPIISNTFYYQIS